MTGTAVSQEAAELLAIMTGEVPVQNAVSGDGPARVREIVNRGDEQGEGAIPIPMVAKDFQDPGLVTIWDVQGNPSLTSRNMLPAQLRKLGPDGNKMFFLHRPNVTSVRGSALCWLHPDGPDRQEYDRLGLVTCNKVLLNEFYAGDHTRKCHPIAFKTIEQLRERREKNIDRELQRAILRQAGTPVSGDNPISRQVEAPVMPKLHEQAPPRPEPVSGDNPSDWVHRRRGRSSKGTVAG